MTDIVTGSDGRMCGECIEFDTCDGMGFCTLFCDHVDRNSPACEFFDDRIG